MKSFPLCYLLAAITASFTLSSCLKDKCEREISYIRVDPVYKSLEEVHTGTAVKAEARPLKNPGQIYYYNNHMFIVENNEGIHIIDNADPSNPVNEAFIEIPGNNDIAIKDDILYANTYVDLLAIDLNDPGYAVVGREEGVFTPLWQDFNTGQIIVEYKETPVTEVMSCDDQVYLYEKGGVWFGGGPAFNGNIDLVADQLSAESNDGKSNTGIAGSLAHFALIGDYLYTIQHDGWSFEVYDLTSPTDPVHSGTVNVGVHLETLFPYQDKLFIGSNTGMFIFDNTNPLAPVQIGMFEHARACDPVFVQGNYAYVTLWDGAECGDMSPNQLDVIDITDLTKPTLVSSFPMESPHGLSVKDNTLMLCEGDFGFKTFDNTDPKTVGSHLLDQEKGLHALDVISLPGAANIAMVIGKNGFYQYSFDDPSDLKLLSIIQVEQ